MTSVMMQCLNFYLIVRQQQVAAIICFFLLIGNYSEVCSQANYPVDNLSVHWTVVENSIADRAQYKSSFIIRNLSAIEFPETGWKIYFNYYRGMRSLDARMNVKHINGDLFVLSPTSTMGPIRAGDSIIVTCASEDWFVNRTDAPAGLYLVWDDEPDKGLAIKRYATGPFSKTQTLPFLPHDQREVSPSFLYKANDKVRNLSDAEIPVVFPEPVDYRRSTGVFTLRKNAVIETDSLFLPEAQHAATELGKLFGVKLKVTIRGNGKSGIVLRKVDAPKEGYTLSISPQQLVITAGDKAGIFYGLQSLKTAIPPVAWSKPQTTITIPCIDVVDYPRFAHRAFMLDVSRNFQPKEQLLKLLDLMALYKLNVFHFHFSDDEGWRIQIPALPELTAIGARRGHTLDNKTHLQPSFGSGPDVNNNAGSGFYTTADVVEILRYAKARHIIVIPEIETPGHARAAVKAMHARYERFMEEGNAVEAKRYLLQHPHDSSQYSSAQLWKDNVMDVSLPSVYTFVETVVDALIEMYKEADVPLTTIHFGGDEVPSGVWKKSPACQQLIKSNDMLKDENDLWYFYFDRIREIARKRGLAVHGWEEIAMRKTKLDGRNTYIANPDYAKDNFTVDVWNNVLGWGAEDLPYKLANAGYGVVLSVVSNFYFDLAYNNDPNETGLHWGGFVDVNKPFQFIPYDYYKNAYEDKFGRPLNRSLFDCKQRLTEYGMQHIKGLQAVLFAELLVSQERMEYMLLPKLLGLAHRAWSKEPVWAQEKDSIISTQHYREDWSAFVNVIGKRELPRLNYYHGGFAYRIPRPGVVVDDNVIKVNMQLPGFTIRYTKDGSEPTIKSMALQGSTIPSRKGRYVIKAFDARGRSGMSSSVEIK